MQPFHGKVFVDAGIYSWGGGSTQGPRSSGSSSDMDSDVHSEVGSTEEPSFQAVSPAEEPIGKESAQPKSQVDVEGDFAGKAAEGET